MKKRKYEHPNIMVVRVNVESALAAGSMNGSGAASDITGGGEADEGVEGQAKLFDGSFWDE